MENEPTQKASKIKKNNNKNKLLEPSKKSKIISKE